MKWRCTDREAYGKLCTNLKIKFASFGAMSLKSDFMRAKKFACQALRGNTNTRILNIISYYITKIIISIHIF